jgi:transposase
VRTLLVHGARAYLRVVDKKTDGKNVWARRLKERRHINVVAVALAAKHARIAWAMLIARAFTQMEAGKTAAG